MCCYLAIVVQAIAFLPICCSAGQSSSNTPEKPEVLRIAELLRGGYQTAQIDWSVQYYDEPEPRFYSNKFARDRLLYIDRGNMLGQITVGADRTGEPYAFSEIRMLCDEDRVWDYSEDSLAVEVRGMPASAGMSDIGVLGFREVDAISEHPGEYCLSQESEIKKYEVQESGGLYEVSAYYGESEEFSHVWLLDPAAGFQPIRCTGRAYGEEISRCETNYQEFEGRWFPVEAAFSFQGVPRSRTTVLSATFDQPWHDAELTPADLGILPGMNVMESGQPVGFWDGVRSVSLKEYADRSRKGEIDNSPIMELTERHRAGIAPGRFSKMSHDLHFGLGLMLVRRPGLWEDYTRRFIQFCRLDVDQTRRAWATLKECQIAASERLPGIEKESKTAEVELSQLRRAAAAGKRPKPGSPAKQPGESPSGAVPAPTDAPTPAPTDAPAQNAPPPSPAADQKPLTVPDNPEEMAARIKALEERLDTLYEPIEAIFEKKLKPGLNKLLTPQQQELVAKHDAEVKAKRAAAAAKE